MKGLTHSKTVVRIIFKNFYLFLTSHIEDQELKTSLLAIVIDYIQTSENNEEIHLLIELASTLLKEISELNQAQDIPNSQNKFDFRKIFGDFAKKLLTYESKETTFESKEDTTLSSLLSFLQRVLQTSPWVLEDDEKQRSELALFLFRECLFNVGNEGIHLERVLCKSN